jgi:hypothetical protein
MIPGMSQSTLNASRAELRGSEFPIASSDSDAWRCSLDRSYHSKKRRREREHREVNDR